MNVLEWCKRKKLSESETYHTVRAYEGVSKFNSSFIKGVLEGVIKTNKVDYFLSYSKDFFKPVLSEFMDIVLESSYGTPTQEKARKIGVKWGYMAAKNELFS